MVRIVTNRGRATFNEETASEPDTNKLVNPAQGDSILFIVDDLPIEHSQLKNLDPNGIKNVEVKKGSTASQFMTPTQRERYTSVVMITTKTSKNQDSKGRVQGKVVDAETGQEITGANILIKGTTMGTVSDMAGRYSLQLPEDAETLVISFIGYAKKEVAVEDASRVELQNTDASQQNQSFKVFPSPGNQEVKVRFNLQEAGQLEFQLLDKEGGFLKSITQSFTDTGEQEISIPVDELPADSYFLRVKLNGKYETRRVIVQ